MKKIMFLILVLGLFLVSGCFSNDKSQENFDEVTERLLKIKDDIKNEKIDRLTMLELSYGFTLFNSNDIKIDKNQVKTIYYGIKNLKKNETNFDVEVYCDIDGMDGGNGNNIKFDYFDEINIEKNEIDVYAVMIKPDLDTFATKYLCYLKVDSGDYASKTFYVTIK
jgi:hypothetical protein